MAIATEGQFGVGATRIEGGGPVDRRTELTGGALEESGMRGLLASLLAGAIDELLGPWDLGANHKCRRDPERRYRLARRWVEMRGDTYDLACRVLGVDGERLRRALPAIERAHRDDPGARLSREWLTGTIRRMRSAKRGVRNRKRGVKA